jgi:hypothetical protein
MDPSDTVAFIRDAGYEGLQMEADDPLAGAGMRSGLHMSATGRLIAARDADAICQSHRDLGFALTTLHVGTGFESQAEGMRLIEAVLDASARLKYPLFVETHRATLTQDPRRTLDFIEAFPELLINADFSHWYAGCEMPYGDFQAKLAALQPVFDATRYIHGRMADSSCMQVPVASQEATCFLHFHEMWKRAFAGFLCTSAPHERICFAPELLPNWAVLNGRYAEINYARMVTGSSPAIEETDRWLEALLLCRLANQAFDASLNVVWPAAQKNRWEDTCRNPSC